MQPSVLDHLLKAPAALEPTAEPSLHEWFGRLAACPFEASIDRALWAGFESDRLGYAFVGGYQAALARLFEGTPRTRRSPSFEGFHPSSTPRALTPLRHVRALAVTESGGGHPRAIATTLAEDADGALRLRGEKTFATLASAAEEILVVAKRGTSDDGKPRLVLVRVRPTTEGVTIEERTPTPFAPEVPHAKVKLDVVVRPDDELPGDGYATYVKPFRTIEDTHVLGATLGHLIRVARASGFDRAIIESACTVALALREIAPASATDPTTHLALAGAFHTTRRLLAESASEWSKADAKIRERWERDQPILLIAEAVRQARTSAAWSALD
jgi:acyl-CoA dehydrogenase